MKQLVAALLAFVVVNASAQTQWMIDKAHSNVDFAVTHMVISEVRGSFNDFTATFSSDKEDFTDMKIEATIKTASIFTDNESRDKHLRSNDFLNAEKYPVISFRSTSVKKTGKDSYEVKGDLTIRDVTKAVVLDTKFRGTVADPWGNTRAAFRATTTIDRFEFGTVWDKKIETGGLIVGKAVDITLNLQFTKQKTM